MNYFVRKSRNRVFFIPLMAFMLTMFYSPAVFSFHNENIGKQEYFLKDTLQGNDTVPAEPAWKTGGRSSINFNQVSFVNWAAGGENSYSVAGLVHVFARYRKGKADWSTILDIGYGVIKQAELDMRKSDDRIDLMSKFGYTAVNRWNYSGMLNFRSQMAKGYRYEKTGESIMISDLLSPGYLLASLGMEYKSKNDELHLMISPFTGKTTFVYNDSLSSVGAFGVEQGKNIRNQIGGFFKIAYTKEVWKNVNLAAKIDFFSNYLEKPQNLDVNMETIIMMKVNDYLNATIALNLIYDEDIEITDSKGNTGPRTQFKQLFGLGFMFSF